MDKYLRPIESVRTAQLRIFSVFAANISLRVVEAAKSGFFFWVLMQTQLVLQYDISTASAFYNRYRWNLIGRKLSMRNQSAPNCVAFYRWWNCLSFPSLRFPLHEKRSAYASLSCQTRYCTHFRWSQSSISTEKRWLSLGDPSSTFRSGSGDVACFFRGWLPLVEPTEQQFFPCLYGWYLGPTCLFWNGLFDTISKISLEDTTKCSVCSSKILVLVLYLCPYWMLEVLSVLSIAWFRTVFRRFSEGSCRLLLRALT